MSPASRSAYRLLLLTGRPGIGKTTVIRRLAARLTPRSLAGFFTEEMRRSGRRCGFRAVTLDGHSSTIAHVDYPGPHRVSRYGVDVAAIDRLADTTLRRRSEIDLYLVDEIGKMECLSARFVEAMEELIDASRWIVATIALSGGGFIAEVKKHPRALLREVTYANRDDLADRIAPWLEEQLDLRNQDSNPVRVQ
jgi:nucleoside-triphosphatase